MQNYLEMKDDDRLLMLCQELKTVAEAFKFNRWTDFKTESFAGSVMVDGLDKAMDTLNYCISLYSGASTGTVAYGQIVVGPDAFAYFPFFKPYWFFVIHVDRYKKLEVRIHTGNDCAEILEGEYQVPKSILK